MEHKQALLYVYNQLRKLTPAEKQLLRQLMQHEGQTLTRRQIASILGKKYLVRYDIMKLQVLVDSGLVSIRKTTLAYEYGKPKDYRGSNIRMAGRYYTYTLDASTADYIREIAARMKRSSQQQQPGLLRRIMGR